MLHNEQSEVLQLRVNTLKKMRIWRK